MGNLGCGCPGSMAKVIERPETTDTAQGKAHLVPPTAPYFKDADILISADCVAFAMGSMHQELLKGKALAIACPKLDDTTAYVDKLAHIFSANDIRSITVAIMEVPCCRGLDIMTREALQKSGRDIPLESIIIGINGERRN
jgi:hypothetical protein